MLVLLSHFTDADDEARGSQGAQGKAEPSSKLKRQALTMTTGSGAKASNLNNNNINKNFKVGDLKMGLKTLRCI